MIDSRAHASRDLARRSLGLGMLLLRCLAAAGQSSLPPVPPEVEATDVEADAQTTARELKVITDPTLLKRRVWLETEWNKYKGGVHTVEETLGGLWAWRVSTNQDWAVRLKVPYDWRIAGDAVGDSDKNGWGDLKLGTGTAFRFGSAWRAAGGVELRMPTGADFVGGGDWRLQEFGAVAWDATRWLTLSPSLEYNQSVAEVDHALPQHYLEVFFPVIVLLPDRWSLTGRYESKVDFERNNRLVQSARFQVAKQFSDVPLGLALAFKRPFDGGVKEFQVNLSVTYFFR